MTKDNYMTKTLLTIVISALPLFGAAQSFTSLTFEQAKEKAARESKIILVDVMNKQMQSQDKLKMEKELARRKDVVEIMDKIIGVRVDMATPEGKDFAPLLQMNMYPTYAFLMPNGDLLGVVSPYLLIKDPDLFIEKASQAVTQAEEKRKNTREINFSNISFEEALEKAQKENRIIFIDAVTDNCQPCIMMSRNIFTLDKVADFYNSNFINLSLNLGVEHTDLAKRYNTYAYPVFLFINGKGELIHSESGFTKADEFIEYGKKALSKSNIQFEHGTWSEITAKAKKEHKPIFLDCYTVWCGPCKMMANSVFTQPQVAEYFNNTFINAKFDMEKGEGIELKNKFGVNAYPTYIYISPEGEVLNRLVGSMPAEVFIEKTKKGIEGMGLSDMQKKYLSGERSEKFVLEYLNMLEDANLKNEAQKVAVELLNNSDISKIHTPEYFKLFMFYIQDVDSGVFTYVYKNRDQFNAEIKPAGALDRKFREVWEAGSKRYVSGEGKDAVIDKKGLKKYVNRMKKEGVADYKVIAENAKMYNAEKSLDWRTYISVANEKIKRDTFEKLPEHELYNWGLIIDKSCTDPDLRKEAAGWFKLAMPVLEAKENRRKEMIAKTGGIMAMSMINYQKEFNRLYDSLSGK